MKFSLNRNVAIHQPIVMTDNISCPTHKFPLRKLNTRLTVLQFIVKQNLTTNHTSRIVHFHQLTTFPKSKHLHNLHKKSVGDFHICRNKLR